MTRQIRFPNGLSFGNLNSCPESKNRDMDVVMGLCIIGDFGRGVVSA